MWTKSSNLIDTQLMVDLFLLLSSFFILFLSSHYLANLLPLQQMSGRSSTDPCLISFSLYAREKSTIPRRKSTKSRKRSTIQVKKVPHDRQQKYH